ncbi:MAG: copper homeostasis protein CutC [Pirellulaceae bacterium]
MATTHNGYSPALIEACVDNTATALAAQRLGVGRIELCADLVEGGITPSAGMIEVCRRELELPIFVIIRPRGGDFCYEPAEFQAMQHDIRWARAAGVQGIVAGIVRPDGTIDAERTRELIDLARPLEFTFHRAFDRTRDPFEALDTLIGLGVDRVLTSGQAATAWDGVDLLTRLVAHARGRIGILPGGGVTRETIRAILARTGAREIHVRASGWRDSPMQFRNPRVELGGLGDGHEHRLPAIDSPRLQACVAALRGELK